MRVEEQVWETLMALSLAPGERIPSERVLADQLGLSRPTIRIALSVLVGQGLLEQRMRSGTFVASVDRLVLMEVRLMLEPPAARLAAERAAEDDVEQLKNLVAGAELAVDDPKRFATIDARIHDQVALMTGNSVLYDLTSTLAMRVTEARSTSRHDARLRRRTLACLQQLADAIVAGDGAAAASAMHSHLVDVEASHRGYISKASAVT
jgi:DNA-binding FadR family transcriptional regulator